MLLLDEPTVGLDPIATQDFYQTIAQLKAQGSTVILCSHMLAGVEKYIDRALILGQGQLLAEGSLRELRQQTNLPVSLHIQGSNITLPEQLQDKAKIQDDGIHIQVAPQQKMATLRQLMTLPEVDNIDLHMPSLDDIYMHYMTDFQQKELR